MVAHLTDERFENELKANRNAPQHSRIVPVLAAFKHRRRCHLILPWADGGNLADFWESHSPMHIKADGDLQPAFWCSDSWLLRECIGIAEALTAIHGSGNTTHPGPAFRRQIHADLKPENILCYSSFDGGARSLTLRLADLGEATRVDNGVEIGAAQVPHTKTYRPPEQNPLGLIGFNYDIWCLGCLYLDFITWFLYGRKGVEDFRTAREREKDDPFIADPDGTDIIEDIFFRRVSKTRFLSVGMRIRFKTVIKLDRHIKRTSFSIASSVEIEYKVKESVLTVSPLVVYIPASGANMIGPPTAQQIKTLKEHEKCQSSIYLERFIDFIARKMLIVDTQDRAESSEVIEELRRLENMSLQ